jgi:hypothetical protein
VVDGVVVLLDFAFLCFLPLCLWVVFVVVDEVVPVEAAGAVDDGVMAP